MSVAAPLRCNVTVCSSPCLTSLIPETDPVSLTSALLVSGSMTVLSAAVPDVSNRTVLETVAGMNDSSALPDAVIVSPTPKIVLCGA